MKESPGVDGVRPELSSRVFLVRPSSSQNRPPVFGTLSQELLNSLGRSGWTSSIALEGYTAASTQIPSGHSDHFLKLNKLLFAFDVDRRRVYIKCTQHSIRHVFQPGSLPFCGLSNPSSCRKCG
jgi:hypothetical protein